MPIKVNRTGERSQDEQLRLAAPSSSNHLRFIRCFAASLLSNIKIEIILSIDKKVKEALRVN